MDEVQLEKDEENKRIIASLPEIELKVIIVDEQSMAVLPSDVDVGVDIMLKSSMEDAETEARESEELLSTATDNLKATIEGLLLPILKPQGYTLDWQ